MQAINISHLTKDYGHGRGVFDVDIAVEQGVCYGFLGPNGAGKTTTIRHLMGFSKPMEGSTSINGIDSWQHAAQIKTMVGYLPGEIALPRSITGTEFLDMMAKMRQTQTNVRLKELLDLFELDPNMDTKRMSLGTKRKLAVITAFMHDPEVLILDEPTSGLDPISQQTFIDLILGEKKRGKTIFLSSHIFHEVDATCDRISIIKDGRIISEFVPEEMREASDKIFRISFNDDASFQTFIHQQYRFTSVNPTKLRARVQVRRDGLNDLIACIAGLNVKEFEEFPFTLEGYFMQFYKEDKVFAGVER